jgi:hypothetical protein
MKKVIMIMVVVGMFASLNGCTGIEVKSNISSSPLFHYGERVWVVNNLKYNIEVVNKTWGKENIKSRLSPGQDDMITGLQEGEVLLAKVYKNNGEVVGSSALRVKEERKGGPQIWRVYRYERLR